jgi:proline iminopeptidase
MTIALPLLGLALALTRPAALQSPSHSAPPVDTGYVTRADGVRLYYQRMGRGLPVLIVPGRLFLARDLAPLARRHTVIFYDMRNRGKAAPVADSSLLTIQKDVEDLESVRRHFGVNRFVPVGWSYLGFMVVLYAMDHPDRVERLVQLGPVSRKFVTEYPASLLYRDPAPIPDSAAARLDSLQRSDWARDHPKEFCEESFRTNRVRLVGDPSKAARIESPCDMANEWPVNLARHFRYHFGAIQRLDVPAEAIARRVTMAVLTIHGTHDRNAPYAAGREWALLLPNARLLTIEGAAHQVALDAPEIVLPAIETFLAGRWPDGVERVSSLERGGPP